MLALWPVLAGPGWCGNRDSQRVLGPELEPHGSRHDGAGPMAPGFPPLQCLTVPVCGQT